MTDETTKPVQSAPSQAEPKQSASAPLPSHQPPSTRRALLKHAAGVGAAIGTAGLVSACGSADDQGPGRSPAPARRQVKLKMVTTWLPGFPGLGTGAERFARRVNETSDGSIDIDVYAAGELVDALGAFDAVSQGKADLYHGGEYYWQGKSRAFNFFAALPFGMTAEEIAGWVYYGGGQALWDELSAKFNIKPLMAGNTGTQMGGWYNKEINQVADFAGLRIRMPGLGGEVMSKLGATPVTKAGSEIYVSMEQGNIDASEWVGPWNDLAFGFHRIAKYYYYPGFHEPGTALSVGFNKDVWEGLTKAQKAIMKAAAEAETMTMFAEFNARNAIALREMRSKYKVDIRPFSDDILNQAAAESAKAVRAVAERDDLSKRVYESYQAAFEATVNWSKVSSEPYARARRRMVEQL